MCRSAEAGQAHGPWNCPSEGFTAEGCAAQYSGMLSSQKGDASALLTRLYNSRKAELKLIATGRALELAAARAKPEGAADRVQSVAGDKGGAADGNGIQGVDAGSNGEPLGNGGASAREEGNEQPDEMAIDSAAVENAKAKEDGGGNAEMADASREAEKERAEAALGVNKETSANEPATSQGDAAKGAEGKGAEAKEGEAKKEREAADDGGAEEEREEEDGEEEDDEEEDEEEAARERAERAAKARALPLLRSLRAIRKHKYAKVFAEPDSEDPSGGMVDLAGMQKSVEEGAVTSAQEIYDNIIKACDDVVEFYGASSDEAEAVEELKEYAVQELKPAVQLERDLQDDKLSTRGDRKPSRRASEATGSRRGSAGTKEEETPMTTPTTPWSSNKGHRSTRRPRTAPNTGPQTAEDTDEDEPLRPEGADAEDAKVSKRTTRNTAAEEQEGAAGAGAGAGGGGTENIKEEEDEASKGIKRSRTPRPASETPAQQRPQKKTRATK